MATMQRSAPGSTVVSAVFMSPYWKKRLWLGAKRASDIAISGAVMVVLSPVLLVLATLVKLSSPGPILYRWPVVGKNGIPFTGYKFRSMYLNADRVLDQLRS